MRCSTKSASAEMERKLLRAEPSFFTRMPNSLSSITTISSASIESSPSPPAKSGSSSSISSGVISSNLSRSIKSSLSFRFRSIRSPESRVPRPARPPVWHTGRGTRDSGPSFSFSHRSGGRQPFPFDSRCDHPRSALDLNEREEKLEAQPVRNALRENVSGENAHDGRQQTEFVLRLHEHCQKFAPVEIRDEAEVAVQRAVDRALVLSQQAHAPAAEPLLDRVRSVVRPFHGHEDAGRENRIDESRRVAD